MYWGEWSLCWMLPSFPSLRDPSHCSLDCARLRPAKAPQVLRCARSRLGLGAVRPSCQRLLAAGTLRGGWPEGSVAFSPGSPGCFESSEKPGLAVRCLFFSLPRRRQELRTAGPRLTPPTGDPNSLLRAPFSSRDSEPAAPAALLSRLPDPPRAPGELGQRPRDAGAG